MDLKEKCKIIMGKNGAYVTYNAANPSNDARF